MVLYPGDDKIKYLYKYRPPNDHTLENLIINHLRFSYPREFNDPFDCATRVIYDGSKDDWITWINQLRITQEARIVLEKYLASIDYNGRAFDKERFQEEINSFIVLALSEVNDHILLWSHYAQNHEGICLGFQTKIEGNSLGILFDEPTLKFALPGITAGFLPVRRVRYSIAMPDQYNRLKDDDNKLVEFTITKHLDWQYEKERRIVLPRSFVGTQFLKYKKESLRQIIFGYRINDIFKRKVYDAIKDHYAGLNIQYYQSRPKVGEYTLVLDSV